MNGNDLIRAGYKSGKTLGLALQAAKAAKAAGIPSRIVKDTLVEVLNKPESYKEDALYQAVAQSILDERKTSEVYDLDHPVPYQTWGAAYIEPEAVEQMKRAVRLPVAVKGALMPDAHQGYGLPIGGVLAAENAVIPYAVGVDIACRMRLTLFDTPPYVLEQRRERFRKILEEKTVFGAGHDQTERRDHPVMQDPAWEALGFLRVRKDLAWRQLGTSGSGNHFVEFGALDVNQPIPLPTGTIPPGQYLALLSHSGSRRLGLEIAKHYTDIAMSCRANLPREFIQLSWLDLDQDAGAEYWLAMHLAGAYASANHAVIHEKIAEAVRLPVLGPIENHHNFAGKEQVDGREAVVHRKGATPAGSGVLGVIPGSMSAPGYVVQGTGNPASLSSASHGAGRQMSRTQAKKQFDWTNVKRKLKAEGVELISAGLDESPGAYKDIRQVMAEQADLVTPLAEFRPKLVKMDGSGGPAED